jgi:hypothetical protein
LKGPYGPDGDDARLMVSMLTVNVAGSATTNNNVPLPFFSLSAESYRISRIMEVDLTIVGSHPSSYSPMPNFSGRISSDISLRPSLVRQDLALEV